VRTQKIFSFGQLSFFLSSDRRVNIVSAYMREAFHTCRHDGTCTRSSFEYSDNDYTKEIERHGGVKRR